MEETEVSVTEVSSGTAAGEAVATLFLEQSRRGERDSIDILPKVTKLFERRT